MNYDEITNLYREIGRKFRMWGADKVYLLKARTCQDSEIQMRLEIAVDGMFDKKELQRQSQLQWQDIMIEILDLNENPNLIDEIVEDAILL